MAIGLVISLPAHACTLPKSYYKHVSCTASPSYFLAIKDSGAPVALLGKDGKKNVDLSRYTQVDVSKLKNGLMPVQRGGKVGYVNMQGREVVPAVYDLLIGDPNTTGWARAVQNDRIVVKKDGKLGVVSTSNQVILPFSMKYQTISDFDGGRAQIMTASGNSWINTKGKTVTSANSNTKQPALTAKENIPESFSSSGTSRASANSANPSAVTSTTNAQSNLPQNPLTPSERPQITPPDVITPPWKPVQRDGKWGYVNGSGTPMITFSFDEAMPFAEGLAGVRVANNWGFINLAGDLTIPFRFDDSGVIRDQSPYQGQPPFMFTGGKAWIGNLNSGDKLCVDKQGTNVGC